MFLSYATLLRIFAAPGVFVIVLVSVLFRIDMLPNNSFNIISDAVPSPLHAPHAPSPYHSIPQFASLPERAKMWLMLYQNSTVPAHALAEFSHTIHAPRRQVRSAAHRTHVDALHFENKNAVRVIVVGAGVAGLNAARTLLDAGIDDVVVLEGDHHVGGRVGTFRTPDGDLLEYGAEFIRDWGFANPLTSLAHQQGWTSIELPPLITQHCKQVRNAEPLFMKAELCRRARRFETEVSSSSTWLDAMNKEIDWLDAHRSVLSPAAFRILSQQVEQRWGTSNVSNAHSDLPISANRVLKQRYRALLAYLLDADMRVRTGERVVKIDYSDRERFHSAQITADARHWLTALHSAERDRTDSWRHVLKHWIDQHENAAAPPSITPRPRVKVTTTAGVVYSADFVIVTSSLGVLKTKTMSFVPALPSLHQNALNTLMFAAQFKTFFQLDRPIGQRTASSQSDRFQCLEHPSREILAMHDYPITFNEYPVLTRQPVVMTLSNQLSRPSQHQALLKSTPSVQQPSPLNAPPPSVTSTWTSFFHNATLIKGSTTYLSNAPLSEWSLATDLTTPIASAVYLAGEHTSSDAAATVHGAMQSGRRAALQILENIAVHTHSIYESATVAVSQSPAAAWVHLSSSLSASLSPLLPVPRTAFAERSLLALLLQTRRNYKQYRNRNWRLKRWWRSNRHAAPDVAHASSSPATTEALPKLTVPGRSAFPQPLFQRHVAFAQSSDARVVIVGASVSALAAARRLVDGGVLAHQIRILEPGSRIGGSLDLTDGSSNDRLQDLLLLRQANHENSVFDLLSSHSSLRNTSIASSWHARVALNNSYQLPCEEWIDAGRRLHAIEFGRRDQRFTDIAKLSRSKPTLVGTLSTRQSLRAALWSECQVQCPSDTHQQHVLDSLTRLTIQDTAASASNWLVDLPVLSHDMVVVDGHAALARELIEGPVRADISVRRALILRDPPSTDNVHPVSPPAMQHPSVPSPSPSTSRLNDVHRRNRHSTVTASSGQDTEADHNDLSVHARHLFGHLPFVGERVRENRLDVESDVGGVTIDWSERARVHRALLRADRFIWESLRSAVRANRSFDGVEEFDLKNAEYYVRPPVTVTLKHTGEVVRGDYLILAMDAPSIASLEIKPPLPSALRRALHQVGQMFHVKVQIEFQHAFWLDRHVDSRQSNPFRVTHPCSESGSPAWFVSLATHSEIDDHDERTFFGATPEGFPPLRFLNVARITGQPRLSVSIPIHIVDSASPLTSAQHNLIRQHVIRSLATVFFRGNLQQVPKPTRLLISRPLATNYFQTGTSMTDLRALSAPLGDAIVMTADFQVPEHINTEHGAVVAGRRAAEKILSDIEWSSRDHAHH